MCGVEALILEDLLDGLPAPRTGGNTNLSTDGLVFPMSKDHDAFRVRGIRGS